MGKGVKMKRLEKIINDERNMGLDFIVHIQNKNELEDLIEVLTKLEFQIQLSLKEQTLKEWMEELAKEENYDTCFRIRNRKDDRCVAYNPSVEHWRMFCSDIFENRNGELEFNEGNYDLNSARIEAKRIWKLINEENFGDTHFSRFGFSTKTSEKEIIQCLMGKLNNSIVSENEGKVKWFDNKLGYGFIKNGNEKDIFVHYSNIVSEKKFKKLYKGQKVQFNISDTDRGMQAVNVMVC